MSADFEVDAKIWVAGVWTSELCDVSLQQFPSETSNTWGVLKWYEEGTENESEAYVRVDILDSDDSPLNSDLVGVKVINNTRFNRSIDLSEYPKVVVADVKVRFKLYSLSEQPIVSNAELGSGNKW